MKKTQIKVCPQCGSKSFYVTAHVTQDWKVDMYGNFLECIEECAEVTHLPSDEDIWQCANCGIDGSGMDFNIFVMSPEEWAAMEMDHSAGRWQADGSTEEYRIGRRWCQVNGKVLTEGFDFYVNDSEGRSAITISKSVKD